MSKHYKVQDDLMEALAHRYLDKEPIAVIAAKVNEILDNTLDELAGLQDQADQLRAALENMLMLVESHREFSKAHSARIKSNRMVLELYENSLDNEVTP